MAVTYAQYDASKPVGGRYARGADLTKRGFDEFRSAIASTVGVIGTSLVESPSAGVPDPLIGGDFGAADSDNALRMYKAAYTVNYWIGQLTAGGFFQALADLDKGSSG